jgi:hypothetical protein
MKGKKGHKTQHLLVSRQLNQKMNKRWKSVKVGGGSGGGTMFND